jgi:hypothetical protein
MVRFLVLKTSALVGKLVAVKSTVAVRLSVIVSARQ